MSKEAAIEDENLNFEDEGSDSDDEREDERGISDVLRGGDQDINSFDGMPDGDGVGAEPNSIKYQIDTSDYMVVIERILRGEVKIRDDDGRERYAVPKVWDEKRGEMVEDDSHKLLNNRGVNEVMNMINMFINKHLSLSRFEEKRIYEILTMQSKVMRLYILSNADGFGLDTKQKKTGIANLVLNILHVIEACYLRALRGMTFEGINSSTLSGDSSPQMNGMPNININSGAPGRSMLNPRNWFRR